MYLGTCITIDDVMLCTRADSLWGGRGVMCQVEIPSTLYNDVFQYLSAKKVIDLISKFKSLNGFRFTRHLRTYYFQRKGRDNCVFFNGHTFLFLSRSYFQFSLFEGTK